MARASMVSKATRSASQYSSFLTKRMRSLTRRKSIRYGPLQTRFSGRIQRRRQSFGQRSRAASSWRRETGKTG